MISLTTMSELIVEYFMLEYSACRLVIFFFELLVCKFI